MHNNTQVYSSGAGIIRPTQLIRAPMLGEELGMELMFASEIYQHTGSFKFRAAYHVAFSVPNDHIITASSGNFGQALAYACSNLRKRCTVVMPDSSAKVKIEAVKRYGGEVDLIDTKHVSRSARLQDLSGEHPDAYVASPYNDLLVIEGNASLGRELAPLGFDYIVAPIGGGGLTSGIIVGLREKESKTKVVAAEPLMANDAARSLRAGYIVENDHEPQTIADGARTISLGQYNWEILQTGLDGIIEVPEEYICRAVRQLLLSEAGIKAEPTGALSFAALLTKPEMFQGKSVCCAVSGGNVDPELYMSILKGGR